MNIYCEIFLYNCEILTALFIIQNLIKHLSKIIIPKVSLLFYCETFTLLFYLIWFVYFFHINFKQLMNVFFLSKNFLFSKLCFTVNILSCTGFTVFCFANEKNCFLFFFLDTSLCF